MTFDTQARRRPRQQTAWRASLLLCALALTLSDARVARVRAVIDAALSPFERLAAPCAAMARNASWRWRTARSLATEQEALRRRIVELEAALAGGGAERAALEAGEFVSQATADAPPRAPLVQQRWQRARVLGATSRRYLSAQGIIAGGGDLAIGSWVCALPERTGDAWIDLGTDAGVSAGARAAGVGVIWGRVQSVGPTASRVLCSSDPAFRDVVAIRGARKAIIAQGLLCGEGAGRCRIVQVPATAAVAVGDIVLPLDEADLPLVYGTIVRAELPHGAAHWELRMQPAAGARWPDEVEVLELELNPARLARQPTAQRRE